MLMYPLQEAIDLLRSKINTARKTLLENEEDLEWLKEQATVMDVNFARVHNVSFCPYSHLQSPRSFCLLPFAPLCFALCTLPSRAMTVRAQRKGDVKKKKNVIGRISRRVRAEGGNGRIEKASADQTVGRQAEETAKARRGGQWQDCVIQPERGGCRVNNVDVSFGTLAHAGYRRQAATYSGVLQSGCCQTRGMHHLVQRLDLACGRVPTA